jgi:hypothetical protein
VEARDVLRGKSDTPGSGRNSLVEIVFGQFWWKGKFAESFNLVCGEISLFLTNLKFNVCILNHFQSMYYKHSQQSKPHIFERNN